MTGAVKTEGGESSSTGASLAMAISANITLIREEEVEILRRIIKLIRTHSADRGAAGEVTVVVHRLRDLSWVLTVLDVRKVGFSALDQDSDKALLVLCRYVAEHLCTNASA